MVAIAPRSTRLRCATGSPAFDDTRPRTITLDARRPSVALVPQEVREREAARRECGHEAQRFGKAAALWCAGL